MHQVLHAQEATVASVDTVVTTKLRPVDNVTAVRNLAVDAYRGLVMLLMMGEVLQFSKVYAYFNHSLFWKILAFNQTHTEWSGCSVHDMIQPSFSFLVGVALPYSIRSRQRKGAAVPKMLAHTVWRSLLLIALGIFLRSMNSSQTYFTFEDTLTQIGLGYTFLFLLAFRPTRDQWIAFGAILFGYSLARPFIRFLVRTSTTPRSAFPRIGIIYTPVSALIGTRTAISARPSICGS